MIYKLTKKETTALLRASVIDQIAGYGTAGDCNTLTDEERANMETAKAALIARIGRVDTDARDRATQKLDARLVSAKY